MMNSTVAREALSAPSATGTLPAGAVFQQQPPAPPAPVGATPPGPTSTQGFPPEAREAIAQAIRTAREAAEQARAEAQAAQAAQQGQPTIEVDGDRVIVRTEPGAQGGSGGGGRGESIVIPTGQPFNVISPQVYDLMMAFFVMVAFIAVGIPLARAFGRRAEKRTVEMAPSPELAAQLQRLEHGMEAMAIEIERISESHRYIARLESERRADSALLARPGRRD